MWRATASWRAPPPPDWAASPLDQEDAPSAQPRRRRCARCRSSSCSPSPSGPSSPSAGSGRRPTRVPRPWPCSSCPSRSWRSACCASPPPSRSSGPSCCDLVRERTRPDLLRPLLLTVAGLGVLVVGTHHFANGWPGTGGHPWAHQGVVPGGVAAYAWASTSSSPRTGSTPPPSAPSPPARSPGWW